MIPPRDDARLDATPEWNDEYQAALERADEESKSMSEELRLIDPASDEIQLRLGRIVLVLEDLALAGVRHVEACREHSTVKHALLQSASAHFERAVEEIRKGAECLRETK